MKKRILCLLLVLVLLIGLLPMNVLATQTAPMTTPSDDAGDSDAQPTPPSDDAGDSDAQPTPQDEDAGETDPQPTPPSDDADDSDAQPAPLSADGAQPLAAADGFTEISTADAFAKMSASGKYRLTADITVSEPYTTQFKGTFDGNDKTITLAISYGYAYKYTGLFTEIGSSATIENVKLTGSVTGTSGYGAGALVGKVSGTATIKNCESSASVSYTGTTSSSYTGGLIANANSKVTVENCTVSGAVNTAKGTAGGFIGYSYAAGCSFTNCSASGTAAVNGDAAAAKAYGFCYYSNKPTCSNCTWGAGNTKGSNTAIDGLTQVVDANTRYTVKLTVVPENSTVTFDGTEQTVTDGVCQITDVTPNESHTYVVTPPAESDYASVTETFRNENVEKTITCPLKTYTLTFEGIPSDATLTVQDSSEKAVSANKDGSYTVPSGTYTYSVTGSHAYEDLTNATVTVNRQNTTVTVTPTERAFVTLTFGCDDESAVYTVSYQKSGSTYSTTVLAEENGTYKLHVGCAYSWSYTGEKYVDQSGTIDLTQTTTGGAQTVTIATEAKPQKNADGYYQIGSAAALGWMAAQINNGTYNNNLNTEKFILTADITLTGDWTPIGKSGTYTAFKGIFDGDGHTISGMSVSGSINANYGLFGYVDGGTIKNLTVEGTITITVNGSSSYGIGGIVGNFAGTSGTIENCVSNVTITGGQNAGGIAGYVSGGYSSATKAIRSCANLGSITTNSNNAGGIVGYTYGQVTIDSCYNRGNITSGNLRAGGITAYLNSSYATVQNCYSTGTITATNNKAAIVGNKSSGMVKDCYYLDGCAEDANAIKKTADELKALASTLGSAFVTAPASQNDGYPILSFQIITYPVTFTVTPATATVTIVGQSGTLENGVWTFKLPEGSYAYTVSAFGYTAKSGSITVSSTSVSETVTLDAAAKHPVTFTVTPTEANATITVLWNGETVTPETDGSYQLADGTYTYTIKAKGYAKISETLTISGAGQTVTKALTATTAWDGEETEAPTGSGTQESPYQIDSGAQLAWLANTVNSGSGTGLFVELTDDIDLGGKNWTPIGTETKAFAGSFDGKGHVISGLKVEAAASAGLFGVVNNATLQNVVIRGSVTGTENAGGLVGKLKGSGSIVNCGNEAAVSCEKYAGGLAGEQSGYSGSYSFTGCYNAGSVSSTATSSSYAYAGGILAKVGGKANMTDCYNVGTITASAGYAGGLRGSSGTNYGTLTNCYNAGTTTGKEDSKQGPFGGGPNTSNPTNNCYYLNATMTTDGGRTLFEMMRLAGTLGENWENVAGQNRNLPVLKWQKLSAGTTSTYAPAKNVMFQTEQVYSVGSIAPELTEVPASTVCWTPSEGATAYVLSIWEWKIVDGAPADGLTLVDAAWLEGLSATDGKIEYDCAELLKDEGIYYAAVSVVAADGSYALPTADEADTLLLEQIPYNRMAKVTGLKWNNGKATWDAREGFTKDDFYLVMLYTVEGDAYTYDAFKYVQGNLHQVHFNSEIAVGKTYAFTVSALATNPVYGMSDSRSSGYSENYTPTTNKPEEWVEIKTAQQWIELANTEDTFVTPGDSDSGSLQEQEWGKNYKLAADLDFSTLTDDLAAMSKSLGNVDHPFNGTLDGNGYTIKGLTLANNDCGLFYYIGAEGLVKDLTIEGANVLFADNAAVLAENNYGTIENCKLINCNITTDTGSVIGPMASRNYGKIENSYVRGGTLTSTSTSATGHAGFVGANEEGGEISNCYTSMTVSSKSDYSGGFVGLGYGGTITDCFALGDVTARSYSGGFLGRSVYAGNTYENCYAAGKVTRTGEGGDGFLGGNKPDSAFTYEQYSGDNTVKNCYVVTTETQPEGCGATYITQDDAKKDSFATGLGNAWTRDDAKNGGLPYLKDLDAPEQVTTNEITVTFVLAKYDKTSYSFVPFGEEISVTMSSTGNTRLVDLMDEAVKQNKLTYTYATTTTYGRYIQSINDHAVDPPDGWMFTINDKLSNVSASLATVKDKDRVIWFEGTTENHYVGPTYDELKNAQLEWVNISTAEQLRALAATTDTAELAKNYRLTADIDLGGTLFAGIGTASAPFTGIFDGQKHTVTGLVMNGENNVGFFGVIDGATVKNLKLSNVSITGKQQVGALVGTAKAYLDKTNLANNRASLIGNCTVTGVVTGQESVGGLVGLNGSESDSKTGFSVASSIHGSSFNGTVNGTGNGTVDKIGGLAGDNSGSITNSSASGTVSAATGNMVGGLVGSNSGEIYDSHADSAVTGNEHVGGFVGQSTGKVARAYSLGAVSGKGATGGFAGSISAVDTAVGAGMVTKLPGSSTGYVGGFAGELNGTLVGLAANITVKNVFGNCAQTGEGTLKAAGKAANSTEQSVQTALAAMQLTTWKQVCQKMKELFDVDLPCPELELEKYENSVTVAGTLTVGAAIPVLKDGQSANAALTVTWKVTEGAAYVELKDGAPVLKAKNSTQTAQTAKLELTITDGAHPATKIIELSIAQQTQPTQPDELNAKASTLMHNIAKASVTDDDSWMVLNMTAYATLSDAKAVTQKQQAAITALTALVQSTTNPASDYAKAEIILSNLGVDTSKLSSGNLPAKLRALDMSKIFYYTAPYVLLANLQGKVQLSNAQLSMLLATLESNMGDDGMFSYESGGISYPSADTAGAVLAGLAPLYSTNEAAKRIVDKILASIPAVLDANGSFGNANADAMVIIGLAAMGRDAGNVKATSSGKSLLEGLLSYANAGSTAFQYPEGGVLKDNKMATEQGFRALVALAKLREQNGKAYNIYDSHNNIPATVQRVEELIAEIGTVNAASGNDILAARAAYDALSAQEKAKVSNAAKLAEAEAQYAPLLKSSKDELKQRLATDYLSYDQSKYSKAGLEKLLDAYRTGLNAIGEAKTVEASEISYDSAVAAMRAVKAGQIEVTFRLIGDTDHGSSEHEEAITWITTTTYELAENATVYDLFVEATTDHGLSSIGASGGYVSTIYAPSILGGYALSEFTNGPRSGWMYAVNGQNATVSLNNFQLKDDDAVVWYYTDDYVSSGTIPYAADITPEQFVQSRLGKILTVGKHGTASPTLRYSDLGRSVTFTFKPDEGYKVKDVKVDGKSVGAVTSYTVSKLTISTRIEVEFTDGKLPFTDVLTTDWFYEDVAFVYNEGLFTGTSDTTFSPNAPMTRAMLVTVLYRLEGEPTVTGRSGFADVVLNSYYEDAVTWAADNGIVNGTSTSAFSPEQNVTREQMAAILYRYAQYMKYNTAASASLTRFYDHASVSGYAVTALQWTVAEKLVNGTAGKLLPTGNATRAQVAAILHRFVENVTESAK